MTTPFFIDEDDVLAGSTLADSYRLAIAQVEFMNQLKEHHRVIEVFNNWGERTGIFEAGQKYAIALDDLAIALGFENRAKLIEICAKEGIDLMTLSESSGEEDLAAAVRATGRHFKKRIEVSAGELLDYAELFVNDELHLQHHWIATDLLRLYVAEVIGKAEGHVIKMNVSVARIQQSLLAHEAKMEFTTLPGETSDEASERLRIQFDETLSLINQGTYVAESLERGKMPFGPKNPEAEQFRRYARWFYRNRVIGDSPGSIARTEEPHRDSRHVDDGIRVVAKIFGLDDLREKS